MARLTPSRCGCSTVEAWLFRRANAASETLFTHMPSRVFSLCRRHCSTNRDEGVQRGRYIQYSIGAFSIVQFTSMECFVHFILLQEHRFKKTGDYWGLNRHLIKMPFAAKKLDGKHGRRKKTARENRPFGIILLFFCVSACPSLHHNSRSQGIAPRRRARRAEAPISNEACSYGRRDIRPRTFRTCRTSPAAFSD